MISTFPQGHKAVNEGMLKPVKILFTRFPLESSYSGTEVQTMSLMHGLIARGHAVAFLGSCPILLKLCREQGIAHAKLDIGAPPVTKVGAITFAIRKRHMKRLLVTALREFHGLGAVCMLSLSEKLLLTEEAHSRGIGVYWIEHDHVGRWLTKNPWLPMLRRMSSKATTVAVSSLSRKVYADLKWQGKLVAIPNGADRDHLEASTLRQAQGKPKTAKRGHTSTLRQAQSVTVGCVARLTPEKGIDLLIDAVKDLPKIYLNILGKGKQEKKLRAQVAKLGMEDRVEFTPTASHIGSFYKSLDVNVLPSRVLDPFGLAPAESMMMGVATVVTDACGICDELQNGKDSLVVKANSADALKKALITLSNPKRRSEIAKEGLKTARKKFSIDTMVSAYENLLAS